MRARNGSPPAKIGAAMRAAIFAGTPYATASGGTVPGFEKMSAADIRAFYHTWYMPQNATLVIAGDFEPAAMLAHVHAAFDAVPAGKPPERKPVVVPALPTSTIQSTIDFPIGFGVLAFRLPGSNDPDFPAAQVMAGALASPRGALTNLSATGKVLAALSIANSFPELGAEYVLAIPALGSTPQQAQAAVAGVIESYRSSGLPPELIEAAKNRLLSEKAYAQASISGLAISWAQSILQGTTPDAFDAQIATVSVADVNRVLRKYLTSDHRLSIIVSAQPTTAITKTDPGAAAEHVGFTPTAAEPLPDWAKTALSVAPRAPADDVSLTKTLPNGMRILIKRETVAPAVFLGGVIRSDPQLYEPAGKDGVSQIVSALLGWGSTTYDRTEYAAQLDAIAASVDLGTLFSLQVQPKDFDRGIALLADGLLHPRFPDDGFTIVKRSTIQGVSITNKLPKTKANLAQRQALYPPGDPRRRDVTEQTVAAITAPDVQGYYRTTYRPDETTIAIVGDVAPDDAAAVVQKYFGAWANTGPRPTSTTFHCCWRTRSSRAKGPARCCFKNCARGKASYIPPTRISRSPVRVPNSRSRTRAIPRTSAARRRPRSQW
jgi:zinc protease